MNDFKFALRQLWKSPGFTLVAILTLSLGIGLSTTIFNGANPLLFRALPFRDTESLVYLNETSPKQGFDRMSVSFADFTHWRNESRVFSSMDAWNTMNLAVTGREQPERIEGCQITTGLFQTLGIRPAKGRDFLATENKPDAAPVVILGDHIWERLFARSEDVLGRQLLLNGKAHTIVCVMPPRVRFPNDSDVWVPLVVSDPERLHGRYDFAVVARMKPGVTLAQAQADLNAVAARIAEESPVTNSYIGVIARSIDDAFLDSELRTMGWTMLGSVVFVLAVACANVGSLFLTRALGRQKEFAIRAALGSGRWRTIRQLLSESLLLGLISGTLGLVIAIWGLDVVVSMVPTEIPYWIDFSMDWRVFAFTAGISVLTSILFGLAPALQASRVNVVQALNDAGRGSSGGRTRQSLRSALVIAEVAVASLLLCGTGLMVRSLVNLQSVNPGFNPSGLSLFQVDLSTSLSSSPQERISFFSNALDRLRSIPGVTAAAACSSLPLSGSNTGQIFMVEGQPLPASGVAPVGNLRVVTPGYFSAMQIPLLAGRDFSDADSATSGKVLVIDAALARQFFGTSNPIGQHLRFDASDPKSAREIVGIAADVKHSSLAGESRPGFYVPFTQRVRGSMGIVIRTEAENPPGLFASVRRTIREVDPSLPVYRANTMGDRIRETYWIRRFLSRLLVGFAVLALGLAAVGIAGVVAYAVTQRTQEIGIRMALGAVPADVLRLILGHGLRLVVIGLGLGLLASIALTRMLASQLYGLGMFDPLTTLASAALFMIVALVACWIPASRATRVNPTEALRAE